VIQHIMVHAVLQQSVAGFYADLVTRPPAVQFAKTSNGIFPRAASR